jgi:hypothetical protein
LLRATGIPGWTAPTLPPSAKSDARTRSAVVRRSSGVISRTTGVLNVCGNLDLARTSGLLI